MGILAYTFGDDVAGTRKGLLRGVDAFVGIDILGGHIVNVARVLLLQLVGQGLQAALYGHGGAGAALGLVGEVEVLQFRHVGSGAYLLLQFRGQFALVADGCEDGFAPFVQLFEFDEQVADGGNLHFVEASGGLFAVAGNEGNCGTLFQELYGLLYLTGSEVELLGNDCCVVHGDGFWGVVRKKEPAARALWVWGQEFIS